jgi:hypothetical protein
MTMSEAFKTIMLNRDNTEYLAILRQKQRMALHSHDYALAAHYQKVLHNLVPIEVVKGE